MYKELKTQIKNLIFDVNDLFPLLGRPLIYGWRVLHSIKFIIGKNILESKWQLKYDLRRKNFSKIYWVKPQDIQYCLAKKFNNWNNNTEILEGNWGQSKFLFEELPIYQLLYERFKDNQKWEDIGHYHQVVNQILIGEKKWGCKNKKEFDEKLRKIESFYHHQKKNHNKFIKNDFILKSEENLKNSPLWEDIIVVINEIGNLLFVSGDFSLSIVKLLDIQEIPIKVVARHKKWIHFKRGLLYYARFGSLYQKLTHLDLQEIPFNYGEDRFNIIKENLSISHGTLLDIGTNLGYFCHKFEELGFDCYGVESNWYQFHFLKKLKKAENKKFKIINDSIFNYGNNKMLVFDVVLALYIFHHFLKRKNTYLSLIKLLKRLKVKEFYFGAYNPEEYRKAKVYCRYTPEQFVNFIIKHSCLNKAQLLTKFEDGRTLFKITT
ncbi:MAG: hypothetical protein ACFFCE_10440 [Promethearchaeota archaeon]